MNKVATYFAVASLLLTSSFVYAKKEKEDETVRDEEGRVHIVWLSPNKYRDIRPSNQSGSRFERQVFNELDEKFEELAANLPEGYQMNLTVTDLDLAGEVFPNGLSGSRLGGGFGFGFSGGTTDLRVVERAYIPRITFSYQILDDAGVELLSGDENIKDLSFLDRTRAFQRERPFVYEKRLITRWFEDTVEPEFTQEVVKL